MPSALLGILAEETIISHRDSVFILHIFQHFGVFAEQHSLVSEPAFRSCGIRNKSHKRIEASNTIYNADDSDI